MEEILLIILCLVTILTHSCTQNREAEQRAEENEDNYEISSEYSHFSPYYIWANEVRDTSFSLPRKLLEAPQDFMKALTDIQMINRKWTDTYNYTEKLMFGDTILSRICKEIAVSKETPLFLTDNITDEENYSYHLEVRKGGFPSYTCYSLTEHGVKETNYKISEYYRNLLDEWNKKEMFLIAETDEEKKIVTSTGRIIHIGDVIGRDSGCITRLRCDGDSVYVDMVKLYLWTLEDIMDEAEEIKREEQRRLLKQARQSGM